MINFIFFIGAFIFTMLFYHPLFLGGTLMMSGAYYVTVKGSESWKFLTALIPTIVILSLVNPIFNTLGDTVLFTYLNERTYTLCVVIVIIFIAIASMNSPYLDWNYNDPELAVAGTIMHGFEFLFVRLAPIIFFASIVGIVATYKKR